MALKFSSISSSINRANSAINNAFSNAGAIGSITGRINQGAANIQRLQSQAGNIDIYAREITNGFSDVSRAVGGLSNAASDITNIFGGIGGGGRNVSSLVNSTASNFTNTAGLTGAAASLSNTVDGIAGLSSTGSSFVSLGGTAANLAGIVGSVPTVNGITNTIGALSGSNDSNVNALLSNAKDLGLPTAAAGQLASAVSAVSSASGSAGAVLGQLPQLSSEVSVESLSELVQPSSIETLTNNAIQVRDRESAELIGAVGGEFDNLRQKVEQIQTESGLDNFLNDLSAPWDPNLISGENVVPSRKEGLSRSKIANPLRNHNGFNYVITLGALSQAENNFPETYRESGSFGTYIIKSSGGDYANRYKVFDEGGDDAEYYIDNLEIDAVVAPNPNTSVAMGTTIRFTVTEPYSMGNFVQAVVGAAQEKGFPNAIRAPFCLKIEFVGYDETGQLAQTYVQDPIFIPISIYNMSLNVTHNGSEYEVEAVANSEVGLNDQINSLNTTVSAVGGAVWEVCNGEDRSITAALNQRIKNLEDEDVLAKGDRYIIAFPRDLNGIKNAIAGLTPGVPETLTQEEQVRRERGIAERPDDLEGGTVVEEIVVPPSSSLFDVIDAYARDTSKMNEIGLSFITEDTAEGGDHAQANPSETYNEETNTINRGSSDANVAEKAREHKFGQNESITSAIEKVVLRSRYAAEKATEESKPNGTKQWFKIETQVYIDEVSVSESETGNPARIYVYNCIPYFPDEAKFLGTQERPANTQQLMDAAVKEYNYIYTGVNEDILEFDLTFNQAFQQTVMANYGQNSGASGSLADVAHNSGTDVNHGAGTNRNGAGGDEEVGAAIVEQTEMSHGNAGGSRSQDIKLRVAEMFHDRLINQIADLVSAEMRIFGDPFWMTQQTGNYIGEEAGPNITQDGTVNYMTNEVFVVVNFKTPLDYQVSGATMEMPKVVKKFSGLFSCWAVTNHFSSGKFEQTLKLVRRRGQDDEATTANKGLVEVNDDRAIVEADSPTNGDDQKGQGANNSANSTTGASDPCATTSPVAVPEEFVSSEVDGVPITSEKSTTGGADTAYNPPAVVVSNVTFDPRQGIFPSKPRKGNVNDAEE